MRFLLAKDLRILRRSPLLVTLLVAYPILIAVLVGLALSKGPDKPRVAVLNQLPASSGALSVGARASTRATTRGSWRGPSSPSPSTRAPRRCGRCATATCSRRSSSRATWCSGCSARSR